MGMRKLINIRTMLEMPRIKAEWHRVCSFDITGKDVACIV